MQANLGKSFDKHLVVIQRYNKVRHIQDLAFNLVTFWVQLHDIPIRFMNREVAEGNCSSIGTIYKQNSLDGENGVFVRVRVTIDVSTPPNRVRVISLEGGAKDWVSFK